MINPAKRTSTIELSQIRKMFEVTNPNAINLGIGEPDFDVPENIKLAMEQSIKNNETHYTPNKGYIELREAITQKFKKDNNINTNPENIIVTAGASEALYICAQAFIEKNDEVILPDPSFLSYEACIKLADGKVVGVNCEMENEFKLKAEDVQEKINKNIKEIDELMLKVKEYIEQNLYDENRKSYVRNTEDRRIDISLLGAVYPFNVFSPKEKKVLNTVENINLTLRTYTGGYQRYENDGYRNGSPWPISNLWMTLYYLEIGEKKKAKETFDFVLKTVGKHSFLGEQVDNSTLKPNWVIGLGWSHAMFIIVLEKLSNIK